MTGRTYSVLVLVASVVVSGANVYFHEPSRVLLEPDPTVGHSTFGFSLGYQSGRIITGAPHSDSVGKVFECPLGNVLVTKSIRCEEVKIDVDHLAPYTREYTPNLKLNLGASIAATQDYFLTCAPLWPTMPTGSSKNFSYGTCFVYDKTPHRYHGMLEKYHANPLTVAPFDSMYGGTGWNTLMDLENELLVIAKMALKADIITINSSSPLEQANSLVAKSIDTSREANWRYLNKFRNVGYAMAAGHFFTKETVYAVSATSEIVAGIINFLYAKLSRREKNVKKLYIFKNVTISESSIGSMFGAAMYSADLNLDGLSELLVGAPAQDDDEGGYETGAVHIYLGGDMKTIRAESRHRVILGTEDGSRFGATIAANDIDGDKYPEIFVSAPFEGFGMGALYILSGYETHKEVISYGDYKKISLYQLKLTQKIFNVRYKMFGYSLQIIPDLDGNGCNELAVGSPGSNNTILLRCLPSVNVTVTAELMNTQIVKEQDDHFIVNVCLNVTHLKQKRFRADLTINNEVIGNGASISGGQRRYLVEIPEQGTFNCHRIIVSLSNSEPGEYSFTTKVEMDEHSMLFEETFNNTWVTLSSQSMMEANVEVSRHCTGKDCEPNLDMTIGWLGSGEIYYLGSSNSVTVSLNIENRGNSSFDGCAWVRMSGAPVAQIGCANYNEGYRCYMPKPLKRNAKLEIEIKFNMNQPTNMEKELHVEVYLYDFCKQPEIRKEYNFSLPYRLSPEQVLLKGLNHNQTVTDVTIRDSKINTIDDAQEYLVQNDGAITWKSLNAIISIDIKPFIQDYRLSSLESYGCDKIVTIDRMMFNCTFDLLPHTTAKFIAASIISKESLLDGFAAGRLIVSSSFILYMTSTADVKHTSLSTVITLQKELSFGQNKSSVITLAILSAVIALSVVICILYKLDFFKRKEKTMLEALKQDHIRRQSVMKPSMSSSHDRDIQIDEGLDMEVEDDNAFEIVEMDEPVLQEDNEK